MHYVTLATLFDHALPLYTCEMFSFHRYDHVLYKFALILSGAHSSSYEKSCRSLYIFLQPQCMSVQYLEWA